MGEKRVGGEEEARGHQARLGQQHHVAPVDGVGQRASEEGEREQARKTSEKKCNSLLRKLKKCRKYDNAASLSIEFEETKATLHVALVPAARDYVPNIMIPHQSYASELMEYYKKLKSIAAAYWVQFQREQPSLFAAIAAYRSDVDFGELHVDKNKPTSMYFDPECASRLSIYCYYMMDGRPCTFVAPEE
jgi:hypothetical protein